MENQRIAAYWQDFLKKSGRDEQLAYYECFHFCNTEASANELLALVLAGKKTATASAFPAYEENLPQAGDLSIVTDWEGNPQCVIETKAVAILPFREITWEICKREGEDENLESWRKNHIAFFAADSAELGYEFSWDMPVIFEDFAVVHRFVE